jgi:hypothetical protein
MADLYGHHRILAPILCVLHKIQTPLPGGMPLNRRGIAKFFTIFSVTTAPDQGCGYGGIFPHDPTTWTQLCRHQVEYVFRPPAQQWKRAGYCGLFHNLWGVGGGGCSCTRYAYDMKCLLCIHTSIRYTMIIVFWIM